MPRLLLAIATLSAACLPARAQFPFAYEPWILDVETTEDAVVAAGHFEGTYDFDPGPGEAFRTSASQDMYVATYETDGRLRSVFTTQAIAGAQFQAQRIATAVGPDHSIFVAGGLSGTADFDPGPGQHLLTSTRDCYLARYRADGALDFAFLIGSGAATPNIVAVHDVLADTSGAFYVAGKFNGTADFDPGPGEHVLIESSSGYAYFVAHYDGAGQLDWVFQIDQGYTWGPVWLQPDPLGGIVLAAWNDRTIDVDPSPGQALVEGVAGIPRTFLARYTDEGLFRDVHAIPAKAAEFDIDPDGALSLTGAFSGTVDFDLGPEIHLVESQYGHGFVAKYGADFGLRFAFALGGDSDILVETDGGSSIVGMDDGGVLVSGFFTDSTDFDPGPGSYVLTGDRTGYFARYTASGAVDFAFTLDGFAVAFCAVLPRVVPGPEQTFLTFGSFRGTVDFDPGPGEALLSAGVNCNEFYLARYTESGVIPVGNDPMPSNTGSLAVAPNPFADAAALTFTSTRAGRVRIEAFSVLGRRVALLFDGEAATGQPVTASLDGTRLAPGVYVVRVTGPDGVQTRRVTRLR